MLQLKTLLFAMGLALFGLMPSAMGDELRGVLKVQFPDGLVEADGDGSIVFRVRRKDLPTISVKGTVTRGNYRVDLPETGEFQVLAIRTTDGTGFPIETKRWFPIPKSRTYDVIIRIPRSFDLWVYGPDGRTQLKNIMVLRRLRKYARSTIPDAIGGKVQQIMTGVDSPISFKLDNPESYTYYVYAPGHAWTQITPDPFLGGVQTLQLPPGGVVEVQVIQAGSRRGRVLRIRDLNPDPNSNSLVHELKQYGEKVHVKGLPVGRYSLSSEDPIRPGNMPVYGMAEFEIMAGETTKVKLELTAEPVFQPVPAGGTIKIPAQWGQVDQLTLKLNRLDPYGDWGRSYDVPGSQLTPLPGNENLYQWSLPEVAPGAYNLSFAHTSFSVYRVVHGAGSLRLHFELPPPRTVLVKTEDDRTGEAIHPDNLIWSTVEPAAIGKKMKDTAPFQSERRLLTRSGNELGFSIYGPDAPLRLHFEDPRFEPAELTIDGQGDQQVTWSLHRATGIHLEMRRADQIITWKGNAHILAESGQGKVLRSLDSKTGRQYNLSHPGRYSIRFPRLTGFAPIPPQAALVKDGEVLLVKITLTPL
ncbi:MAG: hypothetical protein GY930_13940 [bacterium]|nr:hypothetical protein [bacterium]